MGRSAKRRDTGPDFWTRELVRARFGGRCARCGRDGATIHHRTPRAMGGTKDPAANYTSNLLLLCGTGSTGCHGHIESHRTEAYDHGWLVRHGHRPSQVPVRLWSGRDVYLDDDGQWSHTPPRTDEPTAPAPPIPPPRESPEQNTNSPIQPNV